MSGRTVRAAVHEIYSGAGPFLTRLGIFQPLADGLKFMLKEDFTPADVRKIYFWLAPGYRDDSGDARRSR